MGNNGVWRLRIEEWLNRWWMDGESKGVEYTCQDFRLFSTVVIFLLSCYGRHFVTLLLMSFFLCNCRHMDVVGYSLSLFYHRSEIAFLSCYSVVFFSF